MQSPAPSALYSLSAPLLEGRTVRFEDFRGQVLLIVNTASQCGFTAQYSELETLYRTYKDRGFAVLGFPCNQFGGQEPGSSAEIGDFCQRNFGVSFPLFSKVDVNGAGAHPLFVFLRRQQPGLLGRLSGGSIRWNFTKFLVDRTGRAVARFAPSRSPKALAPAIEKLLAS